VDEAVIGWPENAIIMQFLKGADGGPRHPRPVTTTASFSIPTPLGLVAPAQTYNLQTIRVLGASEIID